MQIEFDRISKPFHFFDNKIDFPIEKAYGTQYLKVINSIELFKRSKILINTFLLAELKNNETDI